MPLPRDIRRKLAALRQKAVSGAPALREGDALPPEPPVDSPRADPVFSPHESLPAAVTVGEGEGTAPRRAGGLSPRTLGRLKARLAAQTARPDGGVSAPPAAREVEADVSPGPAPSLIASGSPGVLEELLPGEVRVAPVGVCYVAHVAAASVCDWAASVVEGLRDLAPQGETAFLDIETTGLSGLPVFLVGILRVGGSGVSLVQILARDYPEEAALLHETARALRDCSALFTYNGAAFDLPYLRDRAVYHAVEFAVEAAHTDLLPLARRRFRGRFPDCRLETLERHLCGRDRGDDILSSEIPERYREFVRSRDARLLGAIIRHNALDLLALAELLPHCRDGRK